MSLSIGTVGISTGLRRQWGADCQVAFAFRESSVPAALAGRYLRLKKHQE